MAEAMFAQMKQNMWRGQTSYRVTVASAFDQLRPQTFDGSGKGVMRRFTDAPEKLSEIRRFIFTGFTKSCYQMAKFDSDTERKMAVILERDPSVHLWMKPGPNQFKIFDSDGRAYQPDFVVETSSEKLIIETKRASDMTDSAVVRKADAASLWAFIATEFQSKTTGDKPWSYLLVPETAVLENTTVAGLISTFLRIADADLRTRYEIN
jgi:type III restriction enzyme